ncbi:MAG: hypothetical protein WDW36_008688 [Sanguina aurantia]
MDCCCRGLHARTTSPRGPAGSDFDVGSAATCALDTLQSLHNDVGIATPNASLSLGATVRKLLWGVVWRESHEPAGARRALWPKHSIQRSRWRAQQAQVSDRMQVAALVGALVRAVSAVSMLRAPTRPELDSAAVARRLVGIHQLQATTLLTLALVCSWRLECEEDGNSAEYPKWLANVMHTSLHVPRVPLGEMAGMVLHKACSGVFESKAALCTKWEHYAVAHVHGRLQPRCCHLGCGNFERRERGSAGDAAVQGVQEGEVLQRGVPEGGVA